MPTTNTTATVQQPTPQPDPLFGQGGKYLIEASALILAVAAVWALVTRSLEKLLKANKDVHDKEHEKISDKMSELGKDLQAEVQARRDADDHEKANRQQADAALQTEINKILSTVTDHTSRIIQLESNYVHIKDTLDEIKGDIKDIKKG